MSNEAEPQQRKFVSWLNTVLLGIIIAGGGVFCEWSGTRSVDQGERLSAIQASQVTRAELETKISTSQNEFNLRLTAIQNDQIQLRAKLTEMEIKQAAVAAALVKKENQ
jgi:hypothetical protein